MVQVAPPLSVRRLAAGTRHPPPPAGGATWCAAGELPVLSVRHGRGRERERDVVNIHVIAHVLQHERPVGGATALHTTLIWSRTTAENFTDVTSRMYVLHTHTNDWSFTVH